MSRFIAFLRAINVGGRRVKMDHLAKLFVELGFGGVETYIASGNVIFDTETAPDDLSRKQLETRIATHLQARLGYPVAAFIRSLAEIAAVARYRPFTAVPEDAALNVMFLADPLDEATTQKVMALATAIDSFHVNGREVYWLCSRKQSESTFSTNVLEKALRRESTMRTRAMVEKLAARYGTV